MKGMRRTAKISVLPTATKKSGLFLVREFVEPETLKKGQTEES
tara:strand:- start:362 stop:490 length:129 start_codon:yes stop_codon:yes gene_type:complete